MKDRLTERRYREGEVIIEDDTEGEDLYLIADGRVKIVKNTRNGEEKLIALLHAGDFFGELELVDGRARSARVVALEACSIYTMPACDFHRLLETSHRFTARLMQVMSIRLRASNNHFLSELEKYALTYGRELDKSQQLIEAAKRLNSTLDLDKLLDIILETALRVVDGDRGTVYLLDEKMGRLWSRVLKGGEHVSIELEIGKGIAGYVAATGDTLSITDAYLDPRFNPEVDKVTGYRTRNILCMPMKNKDGNIIGVFQLLNKHKGVFTDEDETIIAGLSVHAALAIENARLYEQERTLIRMREEVRLAAKIQNDLLPKNFPVIEDYEIAGRYIPAQMVGGDYVDCIPTDHGRYAICLGDVSGKGLPASLLMANVQATLRGQSLLSLSAKECLRRSNTLLFRSTSDERFVTLFYGILDPKNHQLCFSNAGHDHPFLSSTGGKYQRLKTGGIVLGIMEEFPYEEETISLRKDDVLVVYSDGIAEAMNSREEFFGEQRLAAVIKQHRNRTAEELLGEVISAVQKHADTYPQSDDMTIVVLKRRS